MRISVSTLFRLSFVVLLFSSIQLNAQYTLVDDDVVVIDRVIMSCSYDFTETDIIIPETLDGQSVTGIAGNKSTSLAVFYNKGITSLVLPQNLEMIGRNAFRKNDIDAIDLSGMSNLTIIEESAFEDNLITDVSFSGCTSLRRIESSAFRDNKLSSVDLSTCTSLNWIDYYVFMSNSSLTGIILPIHSATGFAGWQDSNGPIYPGGGTAPKYAGAMRAIFPYTLTDDDVVVNDGIIESCSYDFSASVITIPDELDGQEVRGFAEVEPPVSFGGLPTGIFLNKGLLEINLPSHIDSIAENTFSYNLLNKVDFSGCTALKYIGAYAFDENMISSLDLSDCSSLHTIDKYAFQENKIAGMDLSNCSELVKIGKYAFQMNELTSLDFSSCSSLAFIEQGAFYKNSIGSVDLSPCVNMHFIGEDVFLYNSFSEFTLPVLTMPGFMGWRDANGDIHEGGETVTNFRLSYSAMASYVLKDEDVVMSNGVMESCSYDFSLTDIIIPETLDGQTVVKIGDPYTNSNGMLQGVFEQKGITSLVLPITLDSIGKRAFGSNSIEKLDLSESSISYIGIRAFESSSIDTLIMRNASSLKTIEHYAFSGNTFEVIDLENCSSLDTLRVDVFKNNGNLKSVNLSGCSSLCYIHEDAFSGAGSSLSIQLPISDKGTTYGWIDGNDVRYSNGDFVSDLTILYRIPILYTLTDNDVVVVDGVIESCSYGYTYSDIIIPAQLDGQEVRAIKSGYSRGVFQDKGITSIELPLSLDSIGDVAFYDNKLVNLDLSKVNPIYIGTSAFKGNNLSNVNFEACSKLENIANSAFAENRIASLDFSACEALKIIGDDAFRENEIASIDFNNCNSLVHIGTNSFKENKLSSLDLSVSPVIQVLEQGCFSNNDLASVDFSGVEHLTYIGAYVFDNNDFSSFELPSHFESSLDWIDEESNRYAQSSMVTDFDISYRLPIIYTLKDEDVIVESGEIIACSYDFLLTDILMPNSLDGQLITSIAEGSIGSNSYSGIFSRKGITSIQLATGLEKIGACAFSSNSIDSLDLSVCSNIKVVGKYSFLANEISKLKWSTSIEEIESKAFMMNDLKEIDLSFMDKLIYIGVQAFSLNDFEYLVLPTPDSDGFLYWRDSYDMHFPGNTMVFNLESFYEGVFDEGEVFSAFFSVSDGSNPIVGASITIDGEVKYTDENGEIGFQGLAIGSYDYVVSATGYEDATGTISILGEGVEENVVLSLETGIGEKSSLSVSVYPNPVSELMHIKLPAGEAAIAIELIDIRGKAVYSGTWVEGDEASIGVGDYASGIYLVRVVMKGERVVVERVVVE
jgi:hypothetical protein